MSAENPSFVQGGKSVFGEKETSAPQEKIKVAEEMRPEEQREEPAPPEDTSARDAEKLDAVRERLGLPKEDAEEPVSEAWKETDWEDSEGEKISIADVIEYLGDETVEFNVRELLKQLPRLLKTEPERLEKANPEHPIIIVKQGGALKYVLDGNHRLSKAVATGMENIKGKILDLDKPETPQKFVKMFGRA